MQNFEPPDSKMSPTLVLVTKKNTNTVSMFSSFKGKSLTLLLLSVSACYYITDSTFSQGEAILTLKSNVFVLGQQSHSFTRFYRAGKTLQNTFIEEMSLKYAKPYKNY